MDENLNDAIDLFKKGQLAKAEKICLEIKKIDPQNLKNLNLLGIIFYQKKEFNKSIQILNDSIKLNSNNPELFNNLGIAYMKIKNFNQAIQSFKRAIEINSHFIEPYNNLGVSLKEVKKINEAIEYFEKAIELETKNPKAYNNIGSIYFETNKFEKSIEYFNKALNYDKNFYQAYYNRGNANQKIKFFKESIVDYNKAINLNPEYAEAYIARGNSFKNLNNLDETFKDWQTAYKINSKYNYLIGHIFYLKKKFCIWKNYENDFMFFKNNMSNISDFISPFNSLSTFNSSELQKKIAESYADQNFKNHNLVNEKFLLKKTDFSKKIKIGYYSSDFKMHAMSFLLAEMFESHNKEKFEIIGFSLTPTKNDGMRERIINSFDKFIDVSTKNEKEISEISRNLNIDIAIDLMGFTQLNRFGIFVKKCAPIQINFLGYPGTTGSKYIDYIIADKTLISKTEQKNYSEKIIYLPDTYQCNDSKKNISNKLFLRKDFNLPDDKFIFCCFNQKYKFNPATFETWIKILKKTKNSVLWLLDDENESTINLINEFKSKDLDASRIIFSKKLPLDEHLARHKLADLFLDTFPYGAHTSASDSLWSGLPIITKVGDTFASRVAASLLTAIGIDELITTSDEQYINLAIELANNPKKLDLIKNKLNKNIKTKPLFDTKRFTKNLETGYYLANKRYLENLPAENIEV